MKKIVTTAFFLLSLCNSLPTISMDDCSSDKYKLISFIADDGIVAIEKQNIALIGALCERYYLYLKSSYKNKNVPIPLLPGTAKKEEIILVNEALNARSDTFKDYFEALSNDKRDILLSASMSFKKNGKVIGLHVPEITKRLLRKFLCTNDDIYNRIMALVDSKEKHDLVYYCKKKLIAKKSTMGIMKQPTLFEDWDEFDTRSLFINAYFCSDTTKYPVPLCIGNDVYKTYAYNFVSKQCEYRVTGQKKENSSATYLLWVINHNNPNATVVAPIHHAAPIIGCCFSKTKTNVEYIITYSQDDIIFSKITMSQDGFSDIHSIQVNTVNKGKNITAAYCNPNGKFYIGMYQGMDNRITGWDMDGTETFSKEWPFKQVGLLEKILITSSQAFVLFGAMEIYWVVKFCDLTNASWTFLDKTYPCSARDYNYGTPCNNPPEGMGRLIKTRDEIFIYDHLHSPFASIEDAKEKKKQSSFWQGLKDDLYFEPDDECYSAYNQSGEFLLRNSLKKEFGLLYVTTQILDVITHNRLLSIDTLYNNFVLVCFDNEGKKLIFRHKNISNACVPLWDKDDNDTMAQFEECALQDPGTTSLMARLLNEVKKNGYITLRETDPVCKMLLDWVEKRPELRTFMQKSFPFIKVKA